MFHQVDGGILQGHNQSTHDPECWIVQRGDEGTRNEISDECAEHGITEPGNLIESQSFCHRVRPKADTFSET